VIRVVLAFVLAPLAPVVPLAAVGILAALNWKGAGPPLILGLYTYPLMLVIGLPLYVSVI
jgi:hypothetical protein